MPPRTNGAAFKVEHHCSKDYDTCNVSIAAVAVTFEHYLRAQALAVTARTTRLRSAGPSMRKVSMPDCMQHAGKTHFSLRIVRTVLELF